MQIERNRSTSTEFKTLLPAIDYTNHLPHFDVKHNQDIVCYQEELKNFIELKSNDPVEREQDKLINWKIKKYSSTCKL